MADPQAMLSTQEFAEKAGVSTSTVSKWLRSGKIKGSKEGRKWLIPAEQLPSGAQQGTAPPDKAPAAPEKSPTTAKPATGSTGSSYSVDAFSQMTYLTPFGVERYVKEGRLQATRDASGNLQIDAANLEDPNIQRLIR